MHHLKQKKAMRDISNKLKRTKPPTMCNGWWFFYARNVHDSHIHVRYTPKSSLKSANSNIYVRY